MTKPVGYGNPPQHTRFKKGQSGNPSGRPKKVRTLGESVEVELGRKIEIVEGGRKRRVTKADAVAKRLTNGALSGDRHLTSQLIRVAPVASAQAAAMVQPDEPLSDAELEALTAYLDREVDKREAARAAFAAKRQADAAAHQAGLAPASSGPLPTPASERKP